MEQGYLLVIVSLILTGCTIKQEYSDHLIQKGETHFKDLRQLTFSGENAEAYFSADGKKLIFQSHDGCLLYTSPSPRDRTRSRMPSSA